MKKHLLALLFCLFSIANQAVAQTPFVAWCIGDSTLYFDYGAVPAIGDTYNGQTVTNVWSGTDITATGNNSPAWTTGIYRLICAHVVFTPAFASVTPTSCNAWFLNFNRLTSIEGLNYLNTANVTDMRRMFYDCSSLTSLDVSNFNTENVTDMVGMFQRCSALTSLDISNFNTANVADMWSMFYNCSSLSSLDLSNFNTANVTDMRSMFFGCSSLSSLGLSNFNTENVTDMSYMFRYCSSLTSLDLSSFNTANVTNMLEMFAGNSALTTIYVGDDWTIANVNSSSAMFWHCYNLIGGHGTTYDSLYIDKTYARIDNPEYPGYLTCETCKIMNGQHLYEIGDNQGWHPSQAIEMIQIDTNIFEGIFEFTASLSYFAFITVKPETDNNWDLVNANRFGGATNNELIADGGTYNLAAGVFCLTANPGTYTIVVNLNTLTATVAPKPEAFVAWCSGDSTLYFDYGAVPAIGDTYNGQTVTNVWSGTDVNETGDNYPAWQSVAKSTCTNVVFEPNFADVTPTSCNHWFFDFNYLSSIDGLNYLNTTNVTDMRSMFSNCYALTSLDLSSFNTANVTNMHWMFSNCRALTSLDLSSFNTTNVTEMGAMFSYCYALTSLDLSSFNTANVTNMSSIFYNCTALTSLDLSSFNTINVPDMSWMFYQCRALTSLDLNSFNTTNVTSMSRMFDCCYALTSLDLSSFNTTNVTNMSYMFSGCTALTSLDLSSFNTTNVTNMSGMFTSCTALTSVNVSNFNTINVTNMGNMFYYCHALTSVDLNSFNTTNVTNMSRMFAYCYALTTIKVSDEWTTANVTNSTSMFSDCTSLVGGNGTTYDENHTDATYARIDEQGNPGYLTRKTNNSTALTNDESLISAEDGAWYSVDGRYLGEKPSSRGIYIRNGKKVVIY